MTEDQAMRIADATALRIAAEIVRRRSKRPKSLTVAVLVKVLRNAAGRIENPNGSKP